jgi:hypothetical protein
MKIDELKNDIIKVSGQGLRGIVQTGSTVKGRYIDNWSDIDLFIVEDFLNADNMFPIIRVCRDFGIKNNLHVGLSFLTINEYKSKNIYATYFKALLMKHHFSTGKTEVIYGDLEPQYIDWHRYKDFLLRELNFFKAYYRNGLRDLENQELLTRCIKCATYISTICILVVRPEIEDCWPTQNTLKDIFISYPGDFSLMNEIEEWKDNIIEMEEYKKKSAHLTNYIESFLEYFFKSYQDV